MATQALACRKDIETGLVSDAAELKAQQTEADMWKELILTKQEAAQGKAGNGLVQYKFSADQARLRRHRPALKISKPHQAGATVSSISGSCSSSRSFSKAVASFSGKRNSTGSKYLVGIR